MAHHPGPLRSWHLALTQGLNISSRLSVQGPGGGWNYTFTSVSSAGATCTAPAEHARGGVCGRLDLGETLFSPLSYQCQLQVLFLGKVGDLRGAAAKVLVACESPEPAVPGPPGSCPGARRGRYGGWRLLPSPRLHPPTWTPVRGEAMVSALPDSHLCHQLHLQGSEDSSPLTSPTVLGPGRAGSGT